MHQVRSLDAVTPAPTKRKESTKMKKAIFAFIITSLMLVLSAQAFACEHALAAGIAGPDRAISSPAPGEDNLVASKDRKKAVLCSNCHTFKGGKEHCVKCGKWFAKQGGRAVLCSNCYDFKGGKDHCAKCGKWIRKPVRLPAWVLSPGR